MELQNTTNLNIPEGEVRAIHDSNNQLLWGKVNYNTKYAGNIIQDTLTGKNLFNDQNNTFLSPSVTLTIIDDNSMALYDAGNDGAWKSASFRINGLKTNTDYSYSYNQTNTNTSMQNWCVISSINSVSKYNAKYISGDKITFNTGADTDFTFTFYVQSSGATVAANTATITNVQLEEGTSKTSFEPYCGGVPAPNPSFPMPINVVTGTQTITISDGTLSEDFTVGLTSKNLVNFGTPSAYGCTYTESNGVYTITATANSPTMRFPLLEKIPAGTYTWNGASSLSNWTISPRKTDGTSLGVNGFNVPKTATTTDTMGYIYFYSGIQAGQTSVLDLSNFQLEQGSRDTSYQPYFNYELCKTGTYQDYIYKNGDNWYVKKNNNKTIVDTSTISLNSNYTNVEYAVISKPTDYAGYGGWTYVDLFCTHAEFQASPSGGWDSANNIGRGYTAATTGTFWIGFAKGTGIDAIRSTLTNITFYYPLSTSTDIQITDTTLISQLNAIHEWLTRYGYNATISGNLPIIIDRTNL